MASALSGPSSSAQPPIAAFASVEQAVQRRWTRRRGSARLDRLVRRGSRRDGQQDPGLGRPSSMNWPIWPMSSRTWHDQGGQVAEGLGAYRMVSASLSVRSGGFSSITQARQLPFAHRVERRSTRSARAGNLPTSQARERLPACSRCRPWPAQMPPFSRHAARVRQALSGQRARRRITVRPLRGASLAGRRARLSDRVPRRDNPQATARACPLTRSPPAGRRPGPPVRPPRGRPPRPPGAAQRQARPPSRQTGIPGRSRPAQPSLRRLDRALACRGGAGAGG